MLFVSKFNSSWMQIIGFCDGASLLLISAGDVDHRWINIRKSFVRATKNGKKFYLASDLQFLKKHIKHLKNASCKSKPPKQSIKEEDNDEFHPEADAENLNFQDVLRCQLQSKQQTNVSQNSITKNVNDSLLLNNNQNNEVMKPQENISTFKLALRKLQNSKSDCLSTPKNNVLTGITQSSKKPATSTVHAVMTKKSTEITVPEEDEFAKRKQSETECLEDKLQSAIDSSMQFINNVNSTKKDENDDDIYEKTIREALRSVPFDNIADFVTDIHIIISSFKDQN